MKREAAWRVFASEYNDTSVEIKGEGEMTPSYVVTPLGAKINRLFVIGVLTDVEQVSEAGEFVRAHISDPTGVFTLYSGQYQQDATTALSNIEVPAFVAVVGKARTYTPEEGTLYVSIRPEKVMEVNADARDQWILETCTSTKDRIEAMVEAMKMNQSNAYDLRKLGYSKELSEGIITALKNYGTVDVSKYVTLIQESLQYLTQGKDSLPDLDVKQEEEIKIDEVEIEKPIKETKEKKEEPAEEDSEETEKTVLETIKKIEGKDGASWDAITEKCEKAGLDKDVIEEAITSLMDKGLIYEPILGTIKTT
jgi:RPA family protein